MKMAVISGGELHHVHVCDAADHKPRLATERLHLVQGPHEYCASCAAKMRQIYEVLGTHLHGEPIQLPAFARHEPRRAISLEGV